MSIPKLDWKFTQVFGDKSTACSVADEDVISAMSFDTTGNYLSLGDKAGRLIIFQRNPNKNKKGGVEFQYFAELQSHMREFDYLKSADIEEKINAIQWLRPVGKNMFVVTTNDKTIKLWKLSDKQVKKSELTNKKAQSEADLKIPKLKTIDDGVNPVLKRAFPNLHNYHINSVSVSANGENIISSDDLKIYIWDLENSKTAYNIVDLKPDNFEELSEVITSSQFHPTNDCQFIYSSSKGIIKMGDLRQRSNCDNGVLTIEDKESTSQKNFFTDIVASISDITYSSDGRYIFSRDFLNVKVWDVNMPKKPINTIPIFEPLKSKLCELYENEGIFDKFNISVSKDAKYFMTGLFNSNFHISDRNGENNLQFELNFDKKTNVKHIPKKFYEPLGSKYDYTRKVLKGAWHPTENIVAMACLNCLYFYHCP